MLQQFKQSPTYYIASDPYISPRKAQLRFEKFFTQGGFTVTHKPDMNAIEAMNTIHGRMESTRDNTEFLISMNG